MRKISLILVYIRWKNNIFIEIDWIYAIKLHILTLSQIATLSVTNRDTRHKLRHFQSQIATPSQIATITNCYVTHPTWHNRWYLCPSPNLTWILYLNGGTGGDHGSNCFGFIKAGLAMYVTTIKIPNYTFCGLSNRFHLSVSILDPVRKKFVKSFIPRISHSYTYRKCSRKT